MWASAHYPHVKLRANVITFRMGMVLTVALIGGGLARQLQRQLEASRRAREEADERSRLLRIAAEAGRSRRPTSAFRPSCGARAGQS